MTEPTKPARGRTTRVTQLLILITLAGLLVFVGSVAATAYLFTRTDRGDVSEESFLFVRLEGPLHDAPVPGGLFDAPDEYPATVTEISGAIRHAATDDRIQGVYLRLRAPSAGWAGLQEIRSALVDLRQAGKPCLAYSEIYTSGSYYLASVCDKVVLAPSGVSFVSGLSMSVTYFAETFEKIGVEPEFESVGTFKSAVEPYERTGPSEPAAEAYEAMLDSVYDQMVGAIADGRGKTPEEIRAAIDGMRLDPRGAVSLGLVDALAFPDGVVATLPDMGADDWAEQVTALHEPLDEDALAERFTPLSEYVKELRAKEGHGRKKIAVVYAEGPIQSGDAKPSLFGDAVLTDGAFRDWMRAARDDDDVVAVVVRVNSPGGSGLASDMMWREMERTQAAGKPVVVSMGDYAASGGYFLACGADWIVAQPGTLTGSIGVIGGKFNLAGTYEKVGLHSATFERGELASLLSMTEPWSDAERDVFRAYLESFYDDFVGKVAEGRGMSVEAVDAVAQGRVWTGEQALGHGLVDQLGGLDVALAKAAELAAVDTYGLRRLPAHKSFFEMLMDDLSGSQAQAPALRIELTTPVPGAEAAVRELVLVSELAAHGAAILYLPGNPRIE